MPLLKREALEQAVYSLVELGVNDVQFVVTDKSQKELRPAARKRLERIMIAAAEQSKNFSLPRIHDPLGFQDFMKTLQTQTAHKILFDSDGQPLWNVASIVRDADLADVVCMVGPEGALTEEEMHLAQTAGFILCCLTPTVLRSVQACSVGVGAIRSLLRTH